MEKNKDYVPHFVFKTLKFEPNKPYSLWQDGELLARFPREQYKRSEALSDAKLLMEDKLKAYTGDRTPKWTIMQ